MIIGITGTDGGGKGEVVRYLVEQHDFRHFSARDLFLKELETRGMPNDRAHLRLIANDLRKEFGDDYMVRAYLEEIEKDPAQDAIIESIRALAEVETLKAEGGVLLAVDADQKLRYQRIAGRGSSSDAVTFEEFVEHEKLEMHDPDPHGMQKKAVMEAADFTVTNNGTLKELHEQVENMLDELSI